MTERVRTYDWLHDNMPISFPELSDEEMANKVRMLMRNDLTHESICVGARDRIMCLSKELTAANARIAELEGLLVRAEEHIRTTPVDFDMMSDSEIGEWGCLKSVLTIALHQQEAKADGN